MSRALVPATLLLTVVLGACAALGGAPRPLDGDVNPDRAQPTLRPPAVAPIPEPTPTTTLPPTLDAPPDAGAWRPPPPPAIRAPLGLTIDLYRAGDFVSQGTKDFCVPGAIATMMNVIDRDRALPHPDQATLNQVARRLSTDRLVGAGSEPEGWAGALNEFGYGPYVVRSEPTREAAIEAAARAIRDTGRPVGLLVWRGAHAWVMSGFEGEAHPGTADGIDVRAVYVQDPWHPRVSSIWGPGQSPNTQISTQALAEDYLPWRRPTARYPEKDGQFVLVLPVDAADETSVEASD